MAFKRSVAPTSNHVLLVPATGRGLREPSHRPQGSPTPVAWTPGGEEVIFAALSFAEDGGPPQPSTRSNSGAPPVLWRMPVDGGGAIQLVGSANALGVAVSREGDRLAYTQRTSHWDVWRLDTRQPASEGATRFIASTRFDGNAQFSPDGERVAFTSARSGGFEIWTADSRGSDLVRLTSLGRAGSVGSPRWSPDGTSIAFDYLAEGETGADVLVVGASGGPPRPDHDGALARRETELVGGRTLDLLRLAPQRAVAGVESAGRWRRRRRRAGDARRRVLFE